VVGGGGSHPHVLRTGLQTAVAFSAKWFSRPQGAPSGVCTGQTKPHDSGSSLRTVVVFMVVKNCPRCTLCRGCGGGVGQGKGAGATSATNTGHQHVSTQRSSALCGEQGNALHREAA
jgi:hypothetical protein